jgi:hypothetical protein
MHLIDTRARAHTHKYPSSSFLLCDRSAIIRLVCFFLLFQCMFFFCWLLQEPDRNRRRSCCIGPIHDFCETETKAVDARICVCEVRDPCVTKIK